jgi:ERF superfamily
MSNETVNPETGEITVSPPVAAGPGSARCQLWSAFIKAQAMIEQPKRTKKADVKNAQGVIIYSFPYAPLDEVLDAARKPLADNGLAIHQLIAERNGKSYVRTQIFHISGECIESDYPLILGQNPNAQHYGGAVTYARRYALLLALGMAAEDDDANTTVGNTAVVSDRSPANRRPATTPVQQPNAVRDTAVETRNKVRAAIENARSTDELNHAWTEDDKTAVTAYVQGSDRIGDRVWATLMKEDADKRLKLVAEADEPGSAEPDYFDPRDQENVFGAR